MSEARERKRDNGSGERPAAGRGDGAVVVVAPSKRIIAISGPKRATRASTGAPIVLTAKGTLYKAKKDTGELSGLRYLLFPPFLSFFLCPPFSVIVHIFCFLGPYCTVL